MQPWPHFDQDEIDAVVSVLKSGKVNYWTGTEVKSFEKEFAAYIGTQHAIALANGTLALELALVALNIGRGDEVITTPKTFVASASAIVARGAKPVFADIDLDSQNMTAESIEKVITNKTQAIICVHLAGWPCEMDKIMALAEQYDLKVIEDCAQAHGAELNGQKVGSFGHAAAFSFCQDKIMTTGGEGGMLLCNDEALWKKAWAYKDHGKEYDTVFHTEHPPGFRWLHESFGTNWRMTEMQAAIGRKQLEKLPLWLEKRRQFAALYNAAFSNIPELKVVEPASNINHACYKYYVQLQASDFSRDEIMACIVEAGGHCYSGSCSEIYLEKCFENEGLAPKARLPMAAKSSEVSLMFLCHPTLTEDDIQQQITAVQNAFAKMRETALV